MGELYSASQELTTNLQKVSSGLSSNTEQLNNSITNMKSQLTNNNNSQSNTLKKDLTDLQKAISDQNNSNQNTANKISQMADQQDLSTDQKQAILNVLNTPNNDSLNKAITVLSDDLNNLISSQSSLNSQIDGLQTSLTKSQNNLSTVIAQLADGSKQLTSGAIQIATGSQKLADGSNQMDSGITQIIDGNQSLTKNLASGAKKSSIKATNLTYEQIAKPTTTKHKERDTAPNNGTGMAPYMISVSLFVGALAFNLMFDSYTPRKFPKTGFAWWASKATVSGIFVVGEALAIFLLLCSIDGLAPVHPFSTFIMLLLTGLTFMSIVHWLNLVLGKVGAFFSMILLVFQLDGSAGTYPIQLSNNFFQAIHPWLPMSYTVNGLRETLMIGDSAIPEIMILSGISLVFSCLSILFFIKRKSHLNQIDFTEENAENSIV